MNVTLFKWVLRNLCIQVKWTNPRRERNGLEQCASKLKRPKLHLMLQLQPSLVTFPIRWPKILQLYQSRRSLVLLLGLTFTQILWQPSLPTIKGLKSATRLHKIILDIQILVGFRGQGFRHLFQVMCNYLNKVFFDVVV